jgi:hypoxanthine-DNA glycosylase
MAIYSFPYEASLNCTKLILGTMPGRISLKRNEYYAHGGNRFWKIIPNIIDGKSTDSYRERIAQLNKKGFALWDVLQHCERKSSSDADIKNEFPNDFQKFFMDYPKIKTIIFNGQTAFDLFKLHVGIENNKEHLVLPSTSPQNNRWYTSEEMINEWRVILN